MSSGQVSRQVGRWAGGEWAEVGRLEVQSGADTQDAEFFLAQQPQPLSEFWTDWLRTRLLYGKHSAFLKTYNLDNPCLKSIFIETCDHLSTVAFGG